MNKIAKLVREIGYREFLKQLLEYEKPELIADSNIEYIIDVFFENDYYTSIFQIQEIIDGMEVQ